MVFCFCSISAKRTNQEYFKKFDIRVIEGRRLQAGRNIHHRDIFARQYSFGIRWAQDKQLGMAKITQHGAILPAKGFNTKLAVRIMDILGTDIVLAAVIFRHIDGQRHEARFGQGREAKKHPYRWQDKDQAAYACRNRIAWQT